LNLPPLSARNLPFIIDAIALDSADPKAGLQTLLDVSATGAEHLVENARLLGIIDAAGLPGEVAGLLRTGSLVEQRDIVRFYLERFGPYAEWKRRIQQGFDPLEAARLTKRSMAIDDSAADIRDWMIGLGTFSGSIRDDGVSVVPVEGSRPSIGSLISDILNRAESVTTVLASYLGPTNWQKLSEPVREHLSTALSKAAANEPPDEAIREAGMAMDKFMAEIGASETSSSYLGLTMGQSAAQLITDGVLLAKHKGFTAYGVALRNGAEHPDTDAELPPTERWAIGANSSLTYLRVVLDFVRSALGKIDGRYEL